MSLRRFPMAMPPGPAPTTMTWKPWSGQGGGLFKVQRNILKTIASIRIWPPLPSGGQGGGLFKIKVRRRNIRSQERLKAPTATTQPIITVWNNNTFKVRRRNIRSQEKLKASTPTSHPAITFWKNCKFKEEEIRREERAPLSPGDTF